MPSYFSGSSSSRERRSAFEMMDVGHSILKEERDLDLI
jgi:hypothetical protein